VQLLEGRDPGVDWSAVLYQLEQVGAHVDPPRVEVKEPPEVP
jgi:hypothetical protein